MNRRVWPMAMILILATCLGVPRTVSSQGNTDCSLPPVTIPLFDATPVSTVAASPIIASPEASPVPYSDDDVTQAVNVIFECINSSDPAQQYAVMTDQYLARLLIESNAYVPVFEALIAEGSEDTLGETIELISIDMIDPEPHGVAVTVTYSNGVSETTEVLHLVPVGIHWLIDDVTAP